VKGCSESSLGRDELGVPAEPPLERYARLVRRCQLRGRVSAGIHRALKHSPDQVRALREVPVQRADSDAGQIGDLLRGRVHACCGEDGFRRLDRTEQSAYAILSRGIESEVLPVAQRYGMGVVVWSPLAKGMLTGRIRKGQQTDLHRAAMFTSFSDEHRLDVIEQVVALAEHAGLRMTHLAMAFAIAHPGVTSALIGPRTMEHLDDLLAEIDVTLSDEILGQIDEIVPPGTDVGTPDQSAYLPAALQQPDLRRRPVFERAASERAAA